MTAFSQAQWISQNYRAKPHKRTRDKDGWHYAKAIGRRFLDRGYRLLGYQNQAFLAAPIFRKKIQVMNVRSAEILITGLGYFELYVNGKKVGDDILSPPYSQYEKTAYYLRYDIKDYLKNGENVIGVQLGNGMYNVHYQNAWNYDVCQWRGLPKFVLQGNILADQDLLLVSDASWCVTQGAIRSDDIYGGETYDARLELPDWGGNDVDLSHCEKAVVVDSPTENLVELNIEPIRVIQEFVPVKWWKIGDKKWVFDLGVNITGFVRLKASAPRGTTVKFTYGEKIEGESLDMKGLYEHTAKRDTKHLQVDRYIFKGIGLETWQPKFTYHGFQYVEVEGLEAVDETTLLGLLIHNDIEKIGTFRCSNQLLNQIYQAMDQAYMNNVLGIPTDCPHREKNGWTGDVNLSIEYFLLSRDSERFFAKWMRDIKDCQNPDGQISAIAPSPGWGYDFISGPVWDSTYIIIPYNMYLYRNNTKVLSDNYEGMKKYLAWQSNQAKNHLIHYGLGDWCPPDRPYNKPKAPRVLTSTLYHYETLRMMAEIATVLGKGDDAGSFDSQAKVTKKLLLQHFVNQDTGFVAGDCQTSYAAVLYFHIVEGELAEKVVQRLVKEVEKHNQHLDTGIIGTKFLLDVLSRFGHTELAVRIATQEDHPSWGYWIKQGATTLWERWDGLASRNHRMFGSIASWMLNDLAGIRPDRTRPGLDHILIKPNFVENLDWVEGSTKTNNGPVVVRWEKAKEGFTLEITAPEKSVTVILKEEDKGRVIHHHPFEVIYQK